MSRLPRDVVPPASLTDALQRAVRRQHAGDFDGARIRYRQVLESEPQHFEALRLLGDLERQAGNLAEAAGLLRTAVHVDPAREDVHDALGQVLIRSGDSRAAVRSFSRALKLNENYAPTYCGLGQAFEQADRRADARRCYDVAVKLDPSLYDAQLGLARMQLADGERRKARQSFARAVELRPGAAKARLELARLLAENGCAAEARSHVEECLRRDPQTIGALLLRARLLLDDGRFAEAMRDCQRVLQVDPRCAEALVQIGAIHLARENAGAARRAFVAARRLEPTLPAARIGAATARELEGDYSGALAIVRDLARDATLDTEGELLLARLLRRFDRRGEALERLRRRLSGTIELPGPERARIYRQTAGLYEDEGDYSRALYNHVTANDLAPSNFDPDAATRQVEVLERFFTISNGARLGRARSPAAIPVIIVGMPSSGLKQVGRALGAHSRMTSADTDGGLAALAERIAGEVASGWPFPRCLADARSADLTRLARTAWPALYDAPAGDAVVVAASWNTDLYLGLAALLFPNARVIHCAREPRDAALACFFRDYEGEDCGYGTNLRHIVTRLRLHRRILAHWRSCRDLPILCVTREALASEPVNAVKRLLAYLQLGYENDCLAEAVPDAIGDAPAFHTPAHDPSIGRHRNFAALLGTRLDLALEIYRPVSVSD